MWVLVPWVHGHAAGSGQPEFYMGTISPGTPQPPTKPLTNRFLMIRRALPILEVCNRKVWSWRYGHSCIPACRIQGVSLICLLFAENWPKFIVLTFIFPIQRNQPLPYIIKRKKFPGFVKGVAWNGPKKNFSMCVAPIVAYWFFNPYTPGKKNFPL